MNALEGVLCHCDQTDGLPQDGHELGTPGCLSVIRPGRYGDGWCTKNHYGLTNCPKCHGSAQGTCPECGKQLRVVRIEMRDHAGGKVIYGAAAPGMAPHKSAGQECPGTGRVPTETAFTSGRALYEWQAAQARGAA